MTYAWLALAIGLMVAACLIMAQFFFGAPFMPTHRKTVRDMVALAPNARKMADLGSGDGRIVVAFAKAGVAATGFEMNPILTWWSTRKIKKHLLNEIAMVERANFWKRSFEEFDVLTVFGMDHIMAPLERKIKKEMKPGSVVLSNAFRFPDWEPEKKVGTVFLYRVLELVLMPACLGHTRGELVAIPSSSSSILLSFQVSIRLSCF